MKITKKQWMIIGVVVAIILVWYFFLRKKKNTESDYRAIRKRKRTVGASFNELGPIGTGTGSGRNVGTVSPIAKTPTCPPGCRFEPLSQSGCVCPQDASL
jgi:hypothetical protein